MAPAKEGMTDAVCSPAEVAELVSAVISGSSGAARGISFPLLGTISFPSAQTLNNILCCAGYIGERVG